MACSQGDVPFLEEDTPGPSGMWTAPGRLCCRDLSTHDKDNGNSDDEEEEKEQKVEIVGFASRASLVWRKTRPAHPPPERGETPAPTVYPAPAPLLTP